MNRRGKIATYDEEPHDPNPDWHPVPQYVSTEPQ